MFSCRVTWLLLDYVVDRSASGIGLLETHPRGFIFCKLGKSDIWRFWIHINWLSFTTRYDTHLCISKTNNKLLTYSFGSVFPKYCSSLIVLYLIYLMFNSYLHIFRTSIDRKSFLEENEGPYIFLFLLDLRSRDTHLFCRLG